MPLNLKNERAQADADEEQILYQRDVEQYQLAQQQTGYAQQQTSYAQTSRPSASFNYAVKETVDPTPEYYYQFAHPSLSAQPSALVPTGSTYSLNTLVGSGPSSPAPYVSKSSAATGSSSYSKFVQPGGLVHGFTVDHV